MRKVMHEDFITSDLQREGKCSIVPESSISIKYVLLLVVVVVVIVVVVVV